jgi:hypothetical protein
MNLKDNFSPNYVHKLVSNVLAWLFHYADKTSIEETQRIRRSIIESMESDANNKIGIKGRSLKRLINNQKRLLAELPERTEKNYKMYTYICEELVRKLLAEKPIIHPQPLPPHGAQKAGDCG